MFSLMAFSPTLHNNCPLKYGVIIKCSQHFHQRRHFLKRLGLVNDTSNETTATVEDKEVFRDSLEDRKKTPSNDVGFYVQRNRSGLYDAHRNLLHEKLPYDQPQSWIHLTEKYQRKQFGRYGMASGIDPRICFNTKSVQMKEDFYRKNYQEPKSVHEMMDEVESARRKREEAQRKREADILKKMANLEQWKQELQMKIAKKEAEALAAKERKERLVEEVRRHFGYKIDPRDERFREVLEQKEKEEKKRMKEERRKMKDIRTMAKIIAHNAPASTSTSTTNTNDDNK